MRAASSSSRGIVRMCWTIRKTKNAEPKNDGTHSGLSVLYQCSARQTRNPGIIVTWCGSMIVESKIIIATDRPGQFSRANAYATKLAEKSAPSVVSATRMIELLMYRQNGTDLNARS